MHLASISALTTIFSGAFAGQFVLQGRDSVVQRADPILNPGEISQHAHVFMGSNGLSNDVTYDSLQKSTCSTMGNASNWIVEDHSMYWHPTMYVKAKGSDQLLRVPNNGHNIYYNDHGASPPRDPFEFPPGFRMIAGDSQMRGAAQNVVPGNSSERQNRQNITQWICHESNPTGSLPQGTFGGFPDMAGLSACSAYDGFNGAIHFPQCWNGNDFDQANPTAHMEYAVGDIENGECPDSHPTKLPHIFMENSFDLSGINGEWEEDTFMLAQGDPTGYGWHADFYNGWEQGILSKLIMSCVEDGLGPECSPFTLGGSVDNCTIPLLYNEDVDGPIAGAPGCNPNTTVNPAPPLQPCPLGTYGGTDTPVSSDASDSSVSTAALASSNTIVAPASTVGLSSDSAAQATYTTASSSATSSTSPLADSSSAAKYTHTHWVHTVVTKYVDARAEPTRRAVEFAG
ncbi:MAG: hypothetical protein Q9165_002722 [Trypethelium subeluteriae]